MIQQGSSPKISAREDTRSNGGSQKNKAGKPSSYLYRMEWSKEPYGILRSIRSHTQYVPRVSTQTLASVTLTDQTTRDPP